VSSDRPTYEQPDSSLQAYRRTIHDRFSIPYAFGPNLRVGEAAVAAMGALARIFLGSLLFALWGVSSALVWNSMENHFWRAVVTVPMVLVLLVSMGGLMLGIAALGNLISTRTK